MFDAYVKARVASMQKINAHEAARGTQPSSTHGINAKWGGGGTGGSFFPSDYFLLPGKRHQNLHRDPTITLNNNNLSGLTPTKKLERINALFLPFK